MPTQLNIHVHATTALYGTFEFDRALHAQYIQCIYHQSSSLVVLYHLSSSLMSIRVDLATSKIAITSAKNIGS